VKIERAIRAYNADAHEHHRYRSWEHCYRYFQTVEGTDLLADRERAALQLGFYLASWGMYRGSSFLLQHAYTVHLPVVDFLADTRFAPLRDPNFGTRPVDRDLVPLTTELVAGIKAAYRPFTRGSRGQGATDTLVTKVILGTIGCLPACDRYFIVGFKGEGLPYSALNPKFIARLLDFSQRNSFELQREQESLFVTAGLRYPVMKLVDMYFWQLGYELDPKIQARRAQSPPT
jgi:hypothetical protein